MYEYDNFKIEELDEITSSFIEKENKIICGSCYQKLNEEIEMEKCFNWCGWKCKNGHFLPDLFRYRER